MPKVTVVPVDKLIMVDDEGFNFDFPYPENLSALQWEGTPENGAGHMEFTDDYNQVLGPLVYDEDVKPFVDLWEREKAMLEAKEREQKSDPEKLFARLRGLRDGRIAATDYLAMPDYPLDGDKKAEVLAYRESLRNLPDMPGAPWDGGGSQTPWPPMPEFLKKGGA